MWSDRRQRPERSRASPTPAYEEGMAKKTTTPRSKAAPKVDAAEAAPARKPRTRRTTKAPADKAVRELAPMATSVSAAPEPSDEEIRVRAYHRYLERGGGDGMDFDDWLEAKRDLERSRS